MAFKKKVVKKAGRRPRKVAAARKGGRRLGTKVQWQFGQPLRNAGRAASSIGETVHGWITGRRPLTKGLARRNYNNSIMAGDNISTLPAFKCGRKKPITFSEKVERLANPPVIYKRNYQFSVECDSGKKAYFGYPINDLNSSYSGTAVGMYEDLINQASRLTTDTGTQDPTISTGGQINNRFYVDYYSNKLQMVNSSSNAVNGKVTLYKYNRDTDIYFTNVTTPMTPINLMGLFSTNNLVSLNSGQEGTVGNGWKFDGSTTKSNYNANYTLPGSVLNSGGVCLHTDMDLQPMSRHIKNHMSHFFTTVASNSFTLKPGQQINQHTIMNDLPDIQRYAMDMTYIRGTSYYLVVEFSGGIVGDGTVSSGDGVISTGSVQLSCIMEEKRIVGLRGRNSGGKVVLITSPLTTIAKGAQYTINPDTGVADIGQDEDA